MRAEFARPLVSSHQDLAELSPSLGYKIPHLVRWRLYATEVRRYFYLPYP